MFLAALLAAFTYAQDTVEVGVIQDGEINVVQKMKFPKAGRTELGIAVGIMPFDPFLSTPNLQASLDLHQSEFLSFGAVVGAGYGFKNQYYGELDNAENLRTPYAFRYLTSALVGAQFSPVYGKLSVMGSRVLHHDAYAAVRAGVTLESSVIPRGGTPIAPTVSLAVGTRIFAREKTIIRLELRDDVLVQYRKRTSQTAIKQNVNVLVAWTTMSKKKGS